MTTELSKCCVNLTFHGIGEQTRRLEQGEKDVWVSTEQFCSILDAVAGRSDVRISFDDGNASDVHLALPALRRRALTATFFVLAGRLDTPGFLDEDDVRTLAAAGMTIGCHGMHHRSWRKLGKEELREELLVSKRRLEEIVSHPVTQAACPFGAYDRRALRSLHHYGYERVFTSDRGTAQSNHRVQVRNSVHRGDGPNLLGQIPSLDGPLRRALSHRVKLAVKRWR
jgi:peptidoglycan/xylan/chitin deacetylase (PgdA/CDA1 family)